MRGTSRTSCAELSDQLTAEGITSALPSIVTVAGGASGSIVSAISFFSALQLAVFRKVADIAWVTIAMTGNLMRTTEDVHAAVTGDRDSRGPAVARLALAAAFIVGVGVGAVTTAHLGGQAAFIPAALIAADLAWIFTMRRDAGVQRSEP